MNQVVIKVIGNYSYQTNNCLGQGVYGKVYEGMERDSREKVAIKKIDLSVFNKDKYLENAIFSQIYLLKRFNHPHIIRFRDVLSSKNSLYIITEFCKNGDLKQLLKKRTMKEEEAFDVINQILCGFTQLVQEKIIHRDLKPANILIHDGVYKIGDFGFAKYVDNFGTQMLKSCVGSPIYMAPQLLQRQEYTTKCDIWSIGVIFYQMIFGRHPWTARDQNQLLRTIQNISITNLLKREQISTRASDFLKKCLAYSEQNRVSWSELFDMFILKTDTIKPMKVTSQIQKNSLTKNGRTISQLITPKVAFQSSNTSTTAPSNSNSDINPPKPVRVTSNRQLLTGTHTSNLVTENIKKDRDVVVYKHYLLMQLTQLPRPACFDSYKWDKILFLLAQSTRLRSTYMMSMMSLSVKNNKPLEDLTKVTQKEHKSYQEMQKEVIEGCSNITKIKQELDGGGGIKAELINQERIRKLQKAANQLASEMVKVLVSETKRRPDQNLTPPLQLLTQIIVIGVGKESSLLDSNLNREHPVDPSEFVVKLLNKAERLGR